MAVRRCQDRAPGLQEGEQEKCGRYNAGHCLHVTPEWAAQHVSQHQ